VAERTDDRPPHRLRGTRTGRPALVLSFAAAGQVLDDWLPLGTETDAGLAFYPGAAQLRALVAAQHETAAAAPPPGTGPASNRAASGVSTVSDRCCGC
jgi:hypothetical protein